MRNGQKIINLFDDRRISAVKQIISIADEEDLNQFWEEVITAHREGGAGSHPFFLTLYQLASRFLETEPEPFFEIIVERGDAADYFTAWNRRFVRYALKAWEKREIDYRSNGKRISVRLSKTDRTAYSLTRLHTEQSRLERLLQPVQEAVPHERIAPYDFIGRDDLNELIEWGEDLTEHLFDARKNGFSADSLIRMRSVFSMMAITLNYYPQVEEVARIVSEFSVLVTQHAAEMERMESPGIALIEGFVHNVERWLKVLFVEGGAHLHFMNRSLRADLETIRGALLPETADDAVDLDAIFDF